MQYTAQQVQASISQSIVTQGGSLKINSSTSSKRSSSFMKDCSELRSPSCMVLRLRKSQMIDHWMHLCEELILLCYKASPRVDCLLEIASALYEWASYGRRNANSGATASVTRTNGIIHIGVLNQSLGLSSTVTLDCLPRPRHAPITTADARPRLSCNSITISLRGSSPGRCPWR